MTIRIDVFHHFDDHTTDQTVRKLDQILRIATSLQTGELSIMADLSALESELEANTSVTESVKVLVQGLAAQIVAAGTDQVKLDELVAHLQTNDGSLADLVVANTPAVPPTDPPVA